MAGGNTPRQKMINMMYLVLTAMLALNVSAEVLDAFAKIEGGFGQTIAITNDKNENTLKLFEEAVSTLGNKAIEWRDKADSTRQKTKEINEYIHNIKLEIIKEADGKDSEGISGNRILPDSIGAMDNKDAVNRILLGANRNGKAYELLPKLEEFRNYLTHNIGEDNPAIKNNVDGLLNFSYPKKGLTDTRDWQTFTFDNTPLISAVAMLSKIQVDILNSESTVLDFLKNQIGKEDIKISNIEAAVNNPNGVIMKGSSGEAEVFLVAYDESIQATANIGGRSIPMRNGRVSIPFSGSTIGPNTVSGYLTYLDGAGETQRRDFRFEYTVVEPSMAVSPTKMNVFYLGVDNPVDISVSGVPQNAVKTSISNGTLTPVGGSGQFIVKPAQVGKSTITVTATVNGETKNMGTKEFRVKRVPNPVPSVHGIDGKTIPKGRLANLQGMSAKMPDDFDFDLKFNVTSFTVSIEEGGYIQDAAATSANFTAQQRALMQKAKINSRIYFMDIKVQGPDGVRTLNDLVYTVK